MRAFRAARGMPLWLLAALSALLVLALIWMPYGFGMLGLIEEWGILGTFVRNHHITYIAVQGGPFGATRMRPLDILPFALAYLVNPQSFWPWHVLMAAALLCKALGMAALLYWLIRDRTIAVLGALLFMVYPADTMQMTLRSLHINWSVALTTGGIAAFMWSTELASLASRIAAAVAATTLFVAGVLIYEAGGLLGLLPIILFWARYDAPRALSRLPGQWPQALVWAGGIVLLLANIILVGEQHDIYQASISNDPTQTLVALAKRSPLLLEIGLYRTLIHGWYDGGRMLFSNLSDVSVYLVVFLLLALVALVMYPLGSGRQLAADLRWLIAGLLAVILGYFPYLSSLSHILITQRTYLFAALGGALVVSAIVGLLARISRPGAVALAIGLLACGLGSQWEQLRHYTDLSARQRKILSGIVAAAPSAPTGAEFLITDNSGQLNSDWFLRGELLNDALTYLYGYEINATVCETPGLLWASFEQDPRGVPGTCRDDGSKWTIGVGLASQHVLEKAKAIELTIAPTGEVSNNDGSVAAAPRHQAERWSRILDCWPESQCPNPRRRPSSAFVYDFGRFWSLEEAPWGAGWRDAWWNPPAWQPISYSWMVAPQSRLWFELSPKQVPYSLKVILPFAFAQGVLDKAEFDVNDHKVAVAWSKGEVAAGSVPAEWLNSGLNKVDFHAEIDPRSGNGLAVDRVEISPQP